MNALLMLALAAAMAPGFHGRAEPIGAQARARMSGVSMHAGCPVGFADLRLLTVSHWGFDGRVHRGRLVVHRDAAGQMLGAMRTLYRQRFPIRRMRLVDAYGADDHRSMAAATPPPSTAGSSPAPDAGPSTPTAGRSTSTRSRTPT